MLFSLPTLCSLGTEGSQVPIHLSIFRGIYKPLDNIINDNADETKAEQRGIATNFEYRNLAPQLLLFNSARDTVQDWNGLDSPSHSKAIDFIARFACPKQLFRSFMTSEPPEPTPTLCYPDKPRKGSLSYFARLYYLANRYEIEVLKVLCLGLVHRSLLDVGKAPADVEAVIDPLILAYGQHGRQEMLEHDLLRELVSHYAACRLDVLCLLSLRSWTLTL